MAQAASTINRFRSELGKLVDAFEPIDSRAQVEFTAFTPQEIAAHFLDGEGNPRTDLSYSLADLQAALAALAAISAALNTDDPATGQPFKAALYRFRAS